MKLALLSLALLSVGCAAQEQARTGVIGPDGHTIIWDEPVQPTTGEKLANVLDETLQAAGDFGRGYSNAYNQYPQQQHGTMTATSLTPGQPPTTTFIHY
jgi:hypothetical protein